MFPRAQKIGSAEHETFRGCPRLLYVIDKESRDSKYKMLHPCHSPEPGQFSPNNWLKDRCACMNHPKWLSHIKGSEAFPSNLCFVHLGLRVSGIMSVPGSSSGYLVGREDIPSNGRFSGGKKLSPKIVDGRSREDVTRQHRAVESAKLKETQELRLPRCPSFRI